MKLKERMNIDDLYFGIVLNKLSYSSPRERDELEVYNLFNVSRVKLSVAKWVTMKDEDKKRIDDPLLYLFGDVWGRTEYEFVVCPWPFSDDEKIVQNGRKVDAYQMYVLPNRDLLLDMISRVTKSSAKAFLRDWRKAYKR